MKLIALLIVFACAPLWQAADQEDAAGGEEKPVCDLGPMPKLAPPKDESETTPPKVLQRGTLTYPEEHRAAAREATVTVKYEIDRCGNVSQVTLKEPGDPLFDAAALSYVRSLKYEPARLRDVPIKVVMTMNVRFSPQPESPESDEH